MKSIRGFTLLEIMVALAVFAVLSVMAISIFSTILSNRDHINNRLAELGQLQMAIVMLERDVNQIIDRPIIGSFGNAEHALQADGSTITFTRAGFINPMGAMQRSTLQRVSYHLSGKNLVRTTWDVLDQAPNSKGSERIILPNVSQLSFQFIDKIGKLHDGWPPASTPSPAAADDDSQTFFGQSQTQNQGQLPTSGQATDPNQKPKWPRFPNGIIVTMEISGWGKANFVIPMYAGDLEKIEKASQQQSETNATP